MPRDEKSLVRKINIIKGQLEGIAKMIEDSRDCLEIITQLKAAKSALSKIGVEYAKTYLNECLEKKKCISPKDIETLFKET